MIDLDPLGAYRGRWFTNSEASQIDYDLLGKERTGDNHYWVDRDNNQVVFSGPRGIIEPKKNRKARRVDAKVK